MAIFRYKLNIKAAIYFLPIIRSRFEMGLLKERKRDNILFGKDIKILRLNHENHLKII
jgi:hypothetical protein